MTTATVTRDTPVWVALSATPHAISYVQVGPWRTRVMQAGPEQAEALMLMPGTGGHLEAYAHNISAFAQRYRVIAYDYPGHGYTTHATADLELPDYVEHLVGLMDALSTGKADLIGESLGGWVAVKFAAAHPDRAGSSCSTRQAARWHGRRSWRRSAACPRPPPTIPPGADPGPPGVADGRPATVTDELVAIRQTIYAQPGFAESMRHILCLQDPEIRRRNLITDAELAAVPRGALVVWTSDDPSGPAGAGMEMAKKIRGGRFDLIRGAGHWPQWEQRDSFNQLVLAFLAEP